MLRPTLTADGTAVRLPIRDQLLAPLLDDLATAYAEDPSLLGTLLRAHAESVRRLDQAVADDAMPDYERAMRAAGVDATRELLLDELPTECQTDPRLSPDAAITVAGRITRLAGHIRHTPKGPRP
ncbi:hypothetical protein SEA_CUMBERBATCH_36 [Streptomyces phage Cumberbatch]|uniref:Uncharacterized protein n=1 Tax=Streptomyces phage Cumberbatch TaxID=2736271 RepID=A0A6M9Z4K4_9CAUD|nr:hypothetical protein QEN65_gp36 [Streptomyces phage Cumberbatch]QKN87678.1 hypothetical protein SEA_CUMBERBATCH_36 [Streptomyces phage Cumberbatch]